MRIVSIITMIILFLAITSCVVVKEETQTIEAEITGEEKVTTVGEGVEVKPTGETYFANIEDFQFKPSVIELNVGDTVEWVNKGSVDHTVTFENGDTDENSPPNGIVRTTFTEKGEFRYFCQYHPGMQGSVVVR